MWVMLLCNDPHKVEYFIPQNKFLEGLKTLKTRKSFKNFKDVPQKLWIQPWDILKKFAKVLENIYGKTSSKTSMVECFK